MKPHSTFIFDSYAFDPAEGKIELRYSLDDDLKFLETLLLPTPIPFPASPLLDAALFALHLIGGISYFKTCCPKSIEIRSGSLNPKQAEFWNTVYTKGLGEFFFKNQIDSRGLIRFPASKTEARTDNPPPRAREMQKILVPIGGGKDSIVTMELLRAAGFPLTLLRMGKHPLIDETTRVAGFPLLAVERRLDPQLFSLNTEGALNGHVPITAYLSILTLVLAELYGFDAVAMSNERSASEGNIEYLGEEVNHQWSKGIEFERMLREYARDCLNPSIEYFSLLRPLSELSIAEIFASYSRYFPSMTSCNANWKILAKGEMSKRWCGACPKCAFAFALFAAFLSQEELLEIFGKNLFEDKSLLPLFRQLLGLKGMKPFECVGTPEETAAAFLLAHEKGLLDETPAMRLFLSEMLPKVKDSRATIVSVLETRDDHCIPPRFLPAIHAHS